MSRNVRLVIAAVIVVVLIFIISLLKIDKSVANVLYAILVGVATVVIGVIMRTRK